MKPLLKLIHSIWLTTLLVVFGLPAIASAVSPVPTMFAYDGHNQARNAYDGASPSAFDYDCAAVCVADEKEIQAVGDGGLFVDFFEFLAAETGAHNAAQFAKLRAQYAADEILRQSLVPGPPSK